MTSKTYFVSVMETKMPSCKYLQGLVARCIQLCTEQCMVYEKSEIDLIEEEAVDRIIPCKCVCVCFGIDHSAVDRIFPFWCVVASACVLVIANAFWCFCLCVYHLKSRYHVSY